MRNTNKGIKESRLRKIVKVPIRLLSKARDFYVRGMNEYNNHFALADAAMGCPAPTTVVLPRSFSTRSAESSAAADDYRELVRAVSVKTYGVVLDIPAASPVRAAQTVVPRSRSVRIGRIDEDKPCDFKGDIEARPLIARSRSHAVGGRTGLF